MILTALGVEGIGIDGRLRFADDVLEEEFGRGLIAGLGVVAQFTRDVLDVLFGDGVHEGGAEGGDFAGERITAAVLVAGGERAVGLAVGRRRGGVGRSVRLGHGRNLQGE